MKSFYSTGIVLLSLVALTGFGCRNTQNLSGGSGDNNTLVVWGLWQDSADMEQVVKGFEDQYKIKVDYKKIASVATYEKTLLEALAQGRGPDVFVIHHTWVEAKSGIMSPAPSSIIDTRAMQEEFAEVASKDLVKDGFVYALPVSIDTMALYYNKDILASAGIAKPPATWDEFQRAVERITKVTRLGILEQSAATIGTAANVNRASDILQLLMLQSGLLIKDSSTGRVDIANEFGERATTFYTDFANRSKRVYTWNLQQDYSLDAFASGKSAMMLNYSYNIPTIQAKNPRLNFGIAPIPQIADSKKISFASYWPFAVSVSSRSPETAWTFVRFMTNKNAAASINATQNTPPARLDSVADVARDPMLGVFAEQTLTATSWPRYDIVAVDAIMNKMIDDIVGNTATITDALRSAEDQLKNIAPQS